MQPQYFNSDEQKRIPDLCRQLLRHTRGITRQDDVKRVRGIISEGIRQNHYRRNRYGINPTVHNLETAILLCEKISPDRDMIIAILLFALCKSEFISQDKVTAEWGDDIARLIRGLLKISDLYKKQPAVESDNFRNLLLTFAEDIRVIIIMLVDRLSLMRVINHHPDDKFVRDVAYESNYLYAPLAHRLGLYAIKSELEDLSLKYTNRETYTRIAHKLNETKVSRDAYIADFIKPVKEKLEASGLKFDIKGRTKSIYSIWNKIQKQHNDIEHIYDLFAIRVILDSPQEKEKSDCWTAYSIITDMYKPNPSRMKDWLSIPKSNGYESLHITVSGPGSRWVEVQIRTRRMDLIAEKGLAAHWRYKGLKGENNLDAWMNNVRDILETADSGPMELMKNMKMDLYADEVFVFTPRGDLFRLPAGATLLDFAFAIHTKIGCSCTGGRVNGKNQKLNYRLHNGDTVEINTSASQVPKTDWLNIVVTSKARSKIRQSIHEMHNRAAELGKELLQRRFKNRKIEIEEATLMKTIKKMGFKTVTDFFDEVAAERIDINQIIEQYEQLAHRTDETAAESRSAGEFVMQPTVAGNVTGSSTSDVLIIGNDIKGMNYRLSRCCNPIYGDEVFGFISSEGVIKVHRHDCPNARNIRSRYPYRIIETRWSGKIGEQFGATINIIGIDDIGIVTNISSVINKERDISLRNISIDSHDGIFQGYVVVGVSDTTSLETLIRKIKTIKGVKNVERSK